MKMGDRANVCIVQHPRGNKPDGLVYLYTHWGGYELPQTVANALIRGKGRWDDESYLARIIFSEMIKDDVLDETGFGISTYQVDNEHPIIVVDCESKTVGFAEPGNEPTVEVSYSFDEFCVKKPDYSLEKGGEAHKP